MPNVRLHLAGALPGLKGTVGLPDDVHLLELLNRWVLVAAAGGAS